ncbi:hypothetical protein G6F57_015296 [Rhizopus arrhizus]|uniref:Flavoprotein domain-containing protein n=1 Tax=Rhizopus oryzae TaxID=64495 RepID=A0A9P6WWK5_RHIOR|nr:hypothetical protein G6F23_012420 [Rhizopus arrhizus]KAG1416370.1 hypothetical protein G6F58_006013 [Rhizopus delemar]KAG0752931.1 hypothetical protein G6F24_013287 [Rhizopus arrhizus]KAG0775811.1 hypothetical protein G6F22_013026 [Rhizopus arrhizus]KAG0778882.1 hypothetical protein G6F21_012806 [Rhizopus arrhizus]
MPNILIGATGSIATVKIPLIVNILKQLRNWADIMVIAPLDANTLGKIANGLCDNLLTCVLRAWNVTKPVVACPAMNTSMWTHPFTIRHLDVLTTILKFQIIQPISKKLACGDIGMGAMAEPQFIVDYTLNIINKQTV